MAYNYTTDGYKPIDTSGTGKKVEFEENQVPTPEAEQVTRVELEDVTEGAPVEQEQPLEQAPVVAQPDAKAEERKSRAKTRIKQLLQKEREANERAARAETRANDLERKMLVNKKEDKTALKARLENNIHLLTRQITEAIKSGDADSTVAFQEELINAKVDLAGINKELVTELNDIPESPQSNQVQPQMPERAAEWIDEHPLFRTDPLFNTAAILANNRLIAEGYSPEDDEFYEELDKRLLKKFPEAFGIEEEKGVQSNQVAQVAPNPSVIETKPQDVKPVSPRISEQTVSGSSRPSANTITKKRSTSVDLSPADIAQAERWGISLEAMARRILHSEQNKRQDGYVPIMMPTKN